MNQAGDKGTQLSYFHDLEKEIAEDDRAQELAGQSKSKMGGKSDKKKGKQQDIAKHFNELTAGTTRATTTTMIDAAEEGLTIGTRPSSNFKPPSSSSRFHDQSHAKKITDIYSKAKVTSGVGMNVKNKKFEAHDELNPAHTDPAQLASRIPHWIKPHSKHEHEEKMSEKFHEDLTVNTGIKANRNDWNKTQGGGIDNKVKRIVQHEKEKKQKQEGELEKQRLQLGEERRKQEEVDGIVRSSRLGGSRGILSTPTRSSRTSGRTSTYGIHLLDQARERVRDANSPSKFKFLMDPVLMKLARKEHAPALRGDLQAECNCLIDLLKALYDKLKKNPLMVWRALFGEDILVVDKGIFLTRLLKYYPVNVDDKEEAPGGVYLDRAVEKEEEELVDETQWVVDDDDDDILDVDHGTYGDGDSEHHIQLNYPEKSSGLGSEEEGSSVDVHELELERGSGNMFKKLLGETSEGLKHIKITPEKKEKKTESESKFKKSSSSKKLARSSSVSLNVDKFLAEAKAERESNTKRGLFKIKSSASTKLGDDSKDIIDIDVEEEFTRESGNKFSDLLGSMSLGKNVKATDKSSSSSSFKEQESQSESEDSSIFNLTSHLEVSTNMTNKDDHLIKHPALNFFSLEHLPTTVPSRPKSAREVDQLTKDAKHTLEEAFDLEDSPEKEHRKHQRRTPADIHRENEAKSILKANQFGKDIRKKSPEFSQILKDQRRKEKEKKDPNRKSLKQELEEDKKKLIESIGRELSPDHHPASTKVKQDKRPKWLIDSHTKRQHATEGLILRNAQPLTGENLVQLVAEEDAKNAENHTGTHNSQSKIINADTDRPLATHKLTPPRDSAAEMNPLLPSDDNHNLNSPTLPGVKTTGNGISPSTVTAEEEDKEDQNQIPGLDGRITPQLVSNRDSQGSDGSKGGSKDLRFNDKVDAYSASTFWSKPKVPLKKVKSSDEVGDVNNGTSSNNNSRKFKSDSEMFSTPASNLGEMHQHYEKAHHFQRKDVIKQIKFLLQFWTDAMRFQNGSSFLTIADLFPKDGALILAFLTDLQKYAQKRCWLEGVTSEVARREKMHAITAAGNERWRRIDGRPKHGTNKLQRQHQRQPHHYHSIPEQHQHYADARYACCWSLY